MAASRPGLRALAGAALGALPSLALAAQITVVPTDPPNEGFNDPSAFTPEGGNNARTLGQARRNVFRAAAEQWGAIIDSNVEIVVRAGFEPFADDECAPDSGTLGAAGPGNFIANFTNAPQAQTFYPVALANALAGQDLDPDFADIVANFNGAVDTDPDCLSNARFYYGFDHQGGSGTIDFYNVVMHEIAHGLGFTTGINEDGSAPPDDLFVVFDRLVLDNSQNRFWDEMTQSQRAQSVTNDRNVAFAGNASVSGATAQGLDAGNGADGSGRPLIYVPDPFEPGSSLAHWDTQAFPDLLMEPFATSGVRSNTGVDMTSCLFQDLGWQLLGGVGCPDNHAANTPPEISAIADQSTPVNTSTGAIDFAVTDNGRISPPENLTVSGVSDDQAVVPDGNIAFAGSGPNRTVEITGGAQSGRALITVTVADGVFTARERFEVAVTSSSGNNPPQARDDRVDVLSTETATGNVLADNGNGADTDPDGDTLAVAAVAGASGNVGNTLTTQSGSRLRINANGSFTYTPDGQFAALPPGQQASEAVTYTVQDGNDGVDSATVTFLVTGDPGEDVHADSPNAATVLSIDNAQQTVNGVINVSGDLDYFRFTLSATSDVRLTTTGDTDTFGTVTDTSGNVVAENDDIVLGQQRNFLIETTLAAGTYFLEVRGFDDSVTGAYQLDASATVTSNPPTNPPPGQPAAGGGGSGAWTLAMLPLIFGVRRRRGSRRRD